jgi:hypothetical protein
MTADRPGVHADFQALIAHHFGFVRNLHAAGSLAPVAAVMTMDGRIEGAAFVNEEAGAAESFSDDDAVRLLSEQFIAAARRGEIRATAIFCHLVNRNHPEAPDAGEAELNCIAVLLDHRDGEARMAAFNYMKGADGTWRYGAPQVFDKRPVIFAPQ